MFDNFVDFYTRQHNFYVNIMFIAYEPDAFFLPANGNDAFNLNQDNP